MKEVRMIRRTDPEYPERLNILSDAPGRIWCIGELPGPGPAAAIVGARMCSSYGRAHARELASFLADHGVQVISGMALGIDGYAHEGALRADGRTIAVLGCGADICYPATHKVLYSELAERGGILSEFPPGTQPRPFHFPKRNRIISALADLVIVIEAKQRSGSLITADFALEQGKSVFALPGRIDDMLSEGCNYLIAQGAGILWNYDAVLEELGIGSEGMDVRKGKNALKKAVLLPSDPAARSVFAALSHDPATAEELLAATGLPLGQLQSALLSLVLAGAAEECAPGCYLKTIP